VLFVANMYVSDAWAMKVDVIVPVLPLLFFVVVGVVVAAVVVAVVVAAGAVAVGGVVRSRDATSFSRQPPSRYVFEIRFAFVHNHEFHHFLAFRSSVPQFGASRV